MIVERRFLGALELEEIGDVVGVTERTLERGRASARALQAREQGDGGSA